jgi:hypothetical protein
MATSDTSWTRMPSKPSAIAEQLGHPSVQSGPSMKWYTMSCERPEKRSASVAFPASVAAVAFAGLGKSVPEAERPGPALASGA